MGFIESIQRAMRKLGKWMLKRRYKTMGTRDVIALLMQAPGAQPIPPRCVMCGRFAGHTNRRGPFEVPEPASRCDRCCDPMRHGETGVADTAYPLNQYFERGGR